MTHELKNESKLVHMTDCDHCIDLIFIEDAKYNMHGVFAADATIKCAGFLPIDDLKHLQNAFNFVSYAALFHGCGFEDFIAGVNPQDMPDDKYDKIEKEYFAFAKKAIKQQVLDSGPKDLDAITRTKLKSFSSKIAKCRSFEQIKDAFDDQRFKKTKFGTICEQIFEDVFSRDLGMLALSADACENRAALEGCPLAKAMPVEMFESSKKVADNAYKTIFGEETFQES